MGQFALGQAVPRSEDPRLLRGGGRYIDDMALAGMRYGYVLRSPHAHAKILSIDTKAAQTAPGVQLVLTGADWESSGFGDLAVENGQKRRDGSPMYVPPLPGLVSDRVRRVGDYVAFVVAKSVDQAKDAAELIEVDYDPLPALTETARLLDPDAPPVWEDNPDNICYVHQVGDREATDAAFAKADKIVSHTLTITRVTAAAIETRGCIGDYDPTENHYTL